MTLPSINSAGDLPPGVHPCSLEEVLERFGSSTTTRRLVGMRLRRVFDLVVKNGHVARVIVFGSFVSLSVEPNDVDVFLIMDDTFDLEAIAGEARLVFDHASAQAHFGTSVFWVRRAACFPTEEEMVKGWGLKRDGTIRGIVEITLEES